MYTRATFRKPTKQYYNTMRNEIIISIGTIIHTYYCIEYVCAHARVALVFFQHYFSF